MASEHEEEHKRFADDEFRRRDHHVRHHERERYLEGRLREAIQSKPVESFAGTRHHEDHHESERMLQRDLDAWQKRAETRNREIARLNEKIMELEITPFRTPPPFGVEIQNMVLAKINEDQRREISELTNEVERLKQIQNAVVRVRNPNGSETTYWLAPGDSVTVTAGESG